MISSFPKVVPSVPFVALFRPVTIRIVCTVDCWSVQRCIEMAKKGIVRLGLLARLFQTLNCCYPWSGTTGRATTSSGTGAIGALTPSKSQCSPPTWSRCFHSSAMHISGMRWKRIGLGASCKRFGKFAGHDPWRNPDSLFLRLFIHFRLYFRENGLL